MSDSPYVMVSLEAASDHSEPMRAQLDKDANDCFWFYTTKTNRIASGGKCMLQFAAKDHKLFACMQGTLIEEKDGDVIDRYWSNQVEAWYEDGKSDESLLMLRFELDSAEIWQVDPSVTGLIKLASGATMNPDEMGDHAKIQY